MTEGGLTAIALEKSAALLPNFRFQHTSVSLAGRLPNSDFELLLSSRVLLGSGRRGEQIQKQLEPQH